MRPLHPSTHLLLALAAVVALPPCAVAQHSNPLPDIPTVAEQYLLAAANQERAARNLPLLHRDPQLARAAAQHAQAMAAHGSISHQFAGEPALANRGASLGVAFSRISENVAEAPSAVQIHEMWMNSEGHRANLLDPAIDAAGIRVIARNGELYAVEDFAKTVPSASLEEQEFAIRALIAQLGQIALATAPDATSAARQTCAMTTGFAGAHKPTFTMRFTSDSLTQLPGELKTRIASGRYREAAVGACSAKESPFTSYNFAILLYP
jgi:Cysteine-rich secretory protein family